MKNILVIAAALTIWTSTALAQAAPEAPAASAGITTQAGPSVDVTTTQRTIDSRGVTTEHARTLDRSQSFTSGNGNLSAKTTTDSHERDTVTTPPVVTEKRTTTTTSETTR
jgi:hypothetical protein